jgi:hypothetical protein
VSTVPDRPFIYTLESWHTGHMDSLLRDGITVSFHRGLPAAKPAATVRFDSPARLADLTVWISGECDWAIADVKADVVKHYTRKCESARDLYAVLDDVTVWLMDGIGSVHDMDTPNQR